MKLAPVLLVNLLLIGVSLYAYDSWKGPVRRVDRTAEVEYDDFDPLQADEPRQPRAFGEGSDLLVVGAGDETSLREMQVRVESLEAELSRLRRLLAAGALARGISDDGGAPSSLPAPSLADVGNLADPTFDDRAVSQFELYLDEVNRRKSLVRQRGVIAGQLKRLKLDLTDREEAVVIEQTLAYHQRISKLYQTGWPKDEGGRQRRQEDFAKLHQAFKTTLEGLLPAEAAEKITKGRIGRSRGFIRGTGRSEK